MILSSCRLFGIVLAKLVSFGSAVESDFYDWKTDEMKIKCELESFNKLIGSCTHPNITTSITTSLIRSITLYDVVKSSTINRQPLKKVAIQSLLEDNYGFEFVPLLDQMVEKDISLISFLVQHGMTKDRNSIYSIAVLSSIPPSILLQQLDSIKSTIINSLNIEDVIQSANHIMDNEGNNYSQGLAAINKLKQLDKEDKRVVEVLVKFAQHYIFDAWRENAVYALGEFPSK